MSKNNNQQPYNPTPANPMPNLEQAAEPVIVEKNEATSLQNVRAHATLGEYRKVIVHPTKYAQQNTSIFASIGLYTAEFAPEVMIELPMAIIDLLKTATAAQHYFDENEISEQGQKGAHMTRQARKYVVEMV